MNDDSTTWTLFDIIWPWIGLGASVIILILLFTTGLLRRDRLISRWRDPTWLAWLAVPIYMIHQFEEYGVDFLRQKHAFPDALCTNLNLGAYPVCPIPHEFYLYVNIPLVWFVGILLAIISFKSPFVALGLYGVIITNGVSHIFIGILRQSYNPGLFTAILIFLPSFFWVCKACFGPERFVKAGIAVLIGTGIILHAILISSIFLFISKNIDKSTLDLIQLLNAFTIIFLPWLFDWIFGISSRDRPPLEATQNPDQ
ncbi:MAG TPA: HXXEE domain-containing protein [Puia sp.]|nr:HXXEE domain-containing protein [Puia sp.]